MFPRVILNKAISVDGMTSGFGRVLEWEARHWSNYRHDALLTNVDCLRRFLDLAPREAFDAPAPQFEEGKDPRPILVLWDPEERMDDWERIGRLSFWRGALAVVNEHAGSAYLATLERYSVGRLSRGSDGGAPLELLNELYSGHQVRRILLDVDGKLTADLMRETVVDEVGLMVYPYIVGGDETDRFLNMRRLAEAQVPTTLKLVRQRVDEYEKLSWLHYLVIKRKLKPGTAESPDANQLSELLENVNSGEELFRRGEEILAYVEDAFILALSMVTGLEGLSLSPDEVLGRISPLMERQDALQGKVAVKLTAIGQLPDGAAACDEFNKALAERMNAYGSEVQQSLKRMGVQLPNM